MKNSGSHPLEAANSSDYRPVGIYFEDPVINQLFAELLRVRGVEASVLHTLEDADSETRIITEPQFFPEIPNAQRRSCLVVGNRDAVKDLEAHALTRPLTEEKIDSALKAFLSA